VTTDPVIARLAAANPFPQSARPSAPLHSRRRAVLATALATAVAVPAIAFATDVGGLFGFSTHGRPVATSDTPFSTASSLDEAMTELGFPSTLQLIASRDGVDFYAARRADGHMCFAVDAAPGAAAHKGVGCDLGNPSTGASFPSTGRPIVDFSRFSGGQHLFGFAADGVSTVNLLDGTGDVIASAPVVDNVYVNVDAPAGGSAVEALDGTGTVVYERSFGEAP
jgi:hypothetical protein